MQAFDAIVIGGGPAGSTCARVLARGGLRVAVLDRARFPRVKLCAGWISLPIWDALELSPREYPLGLWEWNRCHVYYGGRRYTVRARGHFIRRYELDDFLLARSGAESITHAVKKVERSPDGSFVIDGLFQASYLIGAGGTHCPVARALFPRKPAPPVGVQEHEFEADPAEVAAHRPGEDGEPALLLHDDLRGYSWAVPKTGWLNVGSGTVRARDVLPAWEAARAFFTADGQLPPSAAPALDAMKGHSYYLFLPEHLADAVRGRALLVGDALGLAQPLTAEGILPAVVSGRLCGEAVLAGVPASYPARLARHPVLADYARIHALRRAGSLLRRGTGNGNNGNGNGARRAPGPLMASAIARGFAWMFSGRPLPAGPVLAAVARTVTSFRTRKRSEQHVERDG